MRQGPDLEELLHELRSPFAVIFTTSSLIGEMPDETRLSEVRRYLGLIQGAVEKGQSLLDSAALELDGDGRKKVADSRSEGAE